MGKAGGLSKKGRLASLVVGVMSASAIGLIAPLTVGAANPTPPFNQCPAIGQDQSCGLLIVVNSNGSTSVFGDPSQPPFDGIEDTLVGVLNNSTQTVSIIPISSSSTTPIFGFDGDGLCAGYYVGTPVGCPFGPSGYEGPNTSFSVTDANTGTVNFPRGLAPGASAYFSLEGAPTPANIIVPRFLAFGDSYQSGEGVPPFTPETDKPSINLCHRSMGAYAPLIVNRTGVPSSVEFWACSGAKIRDFYNPAWNEPAQMDQLSGPPATLITLGVGGNDIGFDTIGRTCTDARQGPFGAVDFKTGYHKDCGKFLDQAGQLQPNKLIDGLTTGNLDAGDNKYYSLKTLYSDLRKKASLARVYVVGYPNPLPLPDAVKDDCQADIMRENGSVRAFGPIHPQFTVHKDDVKWMEKILQRLNSAVMLNALDAGFYFVDNSLTLSGHDVCKNGTDHWIHGVVVKNDSDDPSEFSYHPNAKGQKAIADVVASAIAGPPAGGIVSKVFPGQFVQVFIPVSGGQFQLIVQIAWKGSDVQLSLVSPSGVVYDRTTQAAGVIHTLGSNAESIAIPTPEAGQWTVRLYGANVPGAGENVRVDTTQIPQTAFAPVAAIASSTDRGVIPASIQFDGSGSTSYNGASVASYTWDFGDGTPQASGPTQTHLFTVAGSYTVTLTVTDSNGLKDSATRAVSLTATDQPPTATFFWGAIDPSAPNKLNFDASGSADVDGQIVSYGWNFGDGISGTGVFSAHNYAAPGTYPVTLTVTDNGGLSTSVCGGVTTGGFSLGPGLPCTTTTLTSSPNPAFVGQPVTLTATVSPVAPATGTPSGSVTFFDGSTLLGTVGLSATGVASLTISTLAIGHHTFTAVYGGNSNFASSASTTLVQVVRENKIAFVSNRDGNYEIYVMNPDGSGVKRLTNNPASDTDPVFSPDGRKIAFTSNRGGSIQLWVMNSDGTNPTRLTNDCCTDRSPTWSPDGKMIAYSSNRSGSWMIWKVNVDGTSPVQLTTDAFSDVSPAWSSTNTIAFISNRSSSWQVWTMNADGNGQTQITNDGGHDDFPAWSADGSRIAYTSNRSGSWQIWVTNADGTNATQLTNDVKANDRMATWSPAGTLLAFASNVTGSWQVMVISNSGSGEAVITSGTANNQPNWCCAQAP